MDGRRLADVRAGSAGRPESGGTGYLIGRRLVLTARHVVVNTDGDVWPRIVVRLGHPSYGRQRRIDAEVLWKHPVHDVALLRTFMDQVVDGPPVRWGTLVGVDPVEYAGLGYPLFADYESGRGVEGLRGLLPPLAVGVGGGYILDQDVAPEATAGRMWPGVSGAAIFCNGLLTGVVSTDDEAFGNRRLHAVPTRVLLADAEFAGLVEVETGVAPALEAVELKQFLRTPEEAAQARTPGSLLAPAVEAVAFTGRRQELSDLTAWRDGPARFSVLLVIGEGGQGKTRLAREFSADTRKSGWVSGFTKIGSSIAPDGYSEHWDRRELAKCLRQTTRPVLIITDYAETHPGDVAVIADELTGDPPQSEVRLLLLARVAGSWWDNLTEALTAEIANLIELTPLTGSKDRHNGYISAVIGLARHLAELPEPPTEGRLAEPWSVLAARLADHPPDLSDQGLANALTLHITALVDLLTLAGGQQPNRLGNSVESELVSHERSYLHRVAARHGLLEPAVLSYRTNPDDRDREPKSALDRALAALILLGPCGPAGAEAVGALASPGLGTDVMRWLAALYPPSVEELTLGGVQPDRLAELLLGPILIAQPNLLDQAAALAERDNAPTMLFTLVNVVGHPQFTSVSDRIKDLIVTRPELFAMAAPVLAAALPRTTTLRDGLLRLGKQDPSAFRKNAYAAAQLFPGSSLNRAIFKVSLTELLVGLLRRLMETNADDYRPDLAGWLSNLAGRLADIGQEQAGLDPAQEAVGIYRELAEQDPDAHLPGLAMSLTNLASALSRSGQQEAAQDFVQEAVGIDRELAEQNPDEYLPGLAASVNTLGVLMARSGRPEAAVDALTEAVTIARQLVSKNADEHQALALSLTNLSEQLLMLGQLEAAVEAAQEAATSYRQLARENPDEHLPGLANSLTHLGIFLARSGQLAAAVGPAQEAVTIYRQLAEENPVMHLPHLAGSLSDLANVLSKSGQPAAAVAPAQEAVTIGGQLAEENPGAYLQGLAGSLTSLANILSECGQRVAAVASAQSAVGIYREQTEENPDVYRRELAGSLTNLVKILGESELLVAAAAPAHEAAGIYRDLAEENPDVYRPELATSLNNLALAMMESGQPEVALAPAEEALAIRRQLAEENPAAYLPELAMSLNNLANALPKVGQLERALGFAREAVGIYRELAEENPDAYRPKLASSLNNLANRLSESAQQQAALVFAQEAVAIYRELARQNPDSHLPRLALMLSNLANKLTETGHKDQVEQTWKTAIADLPGESSRLYLTLSQVRYLLYDRDNASSGVALLVSVLATQNLPRHIEADARRLFRGQWLRQPQAVQLLWQSVNSVPVADWVRLTNDDIHIVISWINAESWAKSRDYFVEHAKQLMGPATDVVFDELALSIPAELVERYRILLAGIRLYGLAEAYRPLLLSDTMDEWIETPDNETSRVFLGAHPELLEEESVYFLDRMKGDKSDGGISNAEIFVHEAVLILARGSVGVDRAYLCLDDQEALGTVLAEALMARDDRQIYACATIETWVHRHTFLGFFHVILSRILAEPMHQLPPELAEELATLADQANADERNQATTQLAAFLSGASLDSAVALQLRQTLGVSADP